jgi:hypothetical protein
VNTTPITINFLGTIPATLAAATNASLRFGCTASGGTRIQFFNGDLDEIMFFNTTLTAADVLYLYQRRLVSSAGTAGLVSWWKFNEGSGTTATDSVDSNPGTISGCTYVQHA